MARALRKKERAHSELKQTSVTERQVTDSNVANLGIGSDIGEYDDSPHNDDQEPGSVSLAKEVAVFRSCDAKALPYWLTVKEVAEWLRTTAKAIYARNERGQLPGAVRDGRRLLVQRDALLASLSKLTASSPKVTWR